MSIKVNTESWHFKVASVAANSYPSHSLCLYFWQVIIGALLCVALAIVCLFGAFLYLYLVIGGPLGLLDSTITYFFSAVLVSVTGLFALTCVKALAEDKRRAYLNNPEELSVWFRNIHLPSSVKESAPVGKSIKVSGLVVEYIKARKEKVCPHLDFVGGD